MLNFSKDICILIDTGYSHPGHWSNQSTTIALDAATGLPLAIKHIIRGNNYQGSSASMKTYGVYYILKELLDLGLKVIKV